jgi:hypothetical protein
MKVFAGAERAAVIERARMAVAEAGHPEAIGRDGQIISIRSLPPDVAYRAWALSTQQQHIPFERWVAECLLESVRWRSYFDRWGVTYPKVSDG